MTSKEDKDLIKRLLNMTYPSVNQTTIEALDVVYDGSRPHGKDRQLGWCGCDECEEWDSWQRLLGNKLNQD